MKKVLPLEKEIILYILENIVSQLFPNTSFSYEQNSGSQTKRIAQIYNKPTQKGILCKGGGRYILTRSQIFNPDETIILEKIFDIASDYQNLNHDKQKYLISNSMSQVITETLMEISSIGNIRVISKTINKLEHWANETYEGNNISVAIAINTNCTTKSDISFDDFSKEDFSKVLSNAYDTLIEFSSNHFFSKHLVVESTTQSLSVPFRYLSYAEYTQKGNSLVFVLNRNAELLIFYNGKLLFAKRRGDWRFFSIHLSQQIRFSTKLRTEHQRRLYSALFESLLDSSFARAGACVGIVDKKEISLLQQIDLIPKKDFVTKPDNTKSVVLNNIIQNKKFYELDRRIRLEILSIDGSLVLSKDGDIIAAGAILRIPTTKFTGDTSSGGARLAAAKALSEYGISFKVSSDGEITAFHGKSNNSFRFG